MKKIIALLILLASVHAVAEPLDPENYLLKISERLTGKWPSRNEYKELEAQMRMRKCFQLHCLQDFFKTYIDKKMDTPAFYSEASLKVHERFALQTQAVPPFPFKSDDNTTADGMGVETLLIYRVFRNNSPVDELFTSQIQWKGEASQEYAKFSNFYSFEVETDSEKTSEVKDDNAAIKEAKITQYDFTGHPNVAGMFSSQKFLTRYWNTPVNGNRKRAAAVFKIMLCDPMNPALERLTAKAREQALSMGVPESTVTNRTIEEIHKNRHGNQKDCAQCHNRLDPLARTMRPLELGISKFVSKGRLRFYDAVNQPVDFPAANFSDLIGQITKQQKYSDCQMNWLFNWIVGKDVNIHPARFAELLEKFDKDGRRVKDTIASLLLSPEFQGREVKYPMPPSFEKARDILRNCYECHSNFLKSHGAQLKLILSKVSYKLDLPNNGKNRMMPPNYHYWEPTNEEVMSIKTWVSEGAPLVVGRPTLTPEEVRVILGGGK